MWVSGIVCRKKIYRKDPKLCTCCILLIKTNNTNTKCNLYIYNKHGMRCKFQHSTILRSMHIFILKVSNR
jgi:hypothetical protein